MMANMTRQTPTFPVSAVATCTTRVCFHVTSAVFLTAYIFPPEKRLPFTAIYHTVGFKEAQAKVFLSSPITAKVLEVERFTSAQDRFNVTTQRSVNKVKTVFHQGLEGHVVGFSDFSLQYVD